MKKRSPVTWYLLLGSEAGNLIIAFYSGKDTYKETQLWANRIVELCEQQFVKGGDEISVVNLVSSSLN